MSAEAAFDFSAIKSLIGELKDLGLIARVRRVKFGDAELELSAPIDTEPKTIELNIPQQHGTAISDEEAKRLEELELRQTVYGAAQGYTPSDYA